MDDLQDIMRCISNLQVELEAIRKVCKFHYSCVCNECQ